MTIKNKISKYIEIIIKIYNERCLMNKDKVMDNYIIIEIKKNCYKSFFIFCPFYSYS